MDRKIRVAAIGDNCIDYYDSLNESYPGKPSECCCILKRLGGESSYTGAVGTVQFRKNHDKVQFKIKELILLIFKCWMERPQLHMLTL